jgi:hypothetical protein
MGAPVLLRNATDTYVSELRATKNYSTVNKVFLASGGSSDTRYGLIYFGVPSGMAGTTILSAKLRLFNGLGFSGAQQLTVQRLSAKFSGARVTWGNKPGVTGSTVSLSKTSAADGTMWEFDVTAIMQAVANGAAWYGWRIASDTVAAKWLYSAQAADAYRPQLEITWSDSPDAPDRLVPDNGKSVSIAKPILQWDFTDPSGDTTMQSFRLKLYGSLANANADTSAVLDTGTVASDVPQVDLDDTAYGGLAADAQIWWRVLVTDGAGLASALSDPGTFIRKTKGTLTITNPAVGSPAFVNDATPPFSWTFTVRTQVKYEVLLTTPETPGTIIWTTGIVTSTDLAVTPPPGKIKVLGKTYRLIVRIYDDQNRQTVPDDPIYQEATRDFVYQQSGAGAPTAFSGTPDTYKPQIVLQWDRATAPDDFVIYRDGIVIAEDQPVNLLVSGTTYRYTDDEAIPRDTHTWSVAAKVNNVTSSSNPTVVTQVKPIAPMLSLPGGLKPVFFFNPDVVAEKAETSEIHDILGNAPPVLITQSIRGYEGSLSGVLLANTIPGLSAATQLANLLYWRANPGTIGKLVWVDQVMRVVIRNVTNTPLANLDGTVEYLAAFDFFQVDF